MIYHNSLFFKNSNCEFLAKASFSLGYLYIRMSRGKAASMLTPELSYPDGRSVRACGMEVRGVRRDDNRQAPMTMDRSIFTSSDTHFGHRNIIKSCNRPFSGVNEMKHALIERWNRDRAPICVILCGDLSLSRQAHSA